MVRGGRVGVWVPVIPTRSDIYTERNVVNTVELG